MPGAGITPANLSTLATHTGAREFHATAKQRLVPPPTPGNALFEVEHWQTNAAEVAELRAQLAGLPATF
jgi:copper homeostasis protein CutC